MPSDDLDAFTRDLRALAAGLQQRAALEKLGLAQERRMKVRTRKGLDYLSDAFTSYQSDRWKKEREKKELPTAKVDLSFTKKGGGMMDYLGTEVAGGTATIGFEKKEEVAEGHNTGANDLPKREFMGVSPSDEKALAELMGEEIDSILSKLNLDS